MASKIIIAAATAAAIVGAGGTALATTGSDSPSPSTSGTGSSAQHGAHHGKKGKHGKHERGGLLRHTEHGVFVTKGKKGTVTHDLIRGTVTSVSASSIAVKAADGTSMTFAVTKDTKVRQRTVAAKTDDKSGSKTKPGKPTASSIGKVAKGDMAFVAGTGTTTKTARTVLDLKK